MKKAIPFFVAGFLAFLVIGAASITKIGRFEKLELGGTTNRISDDGSALTRNGVAIGGGDTIWTNSVGTVEPVSGQTLDKFRFQSSSSLPDNTDIFTIDNDSNTTFEFKAGGYLELLGQLADIKGSDPNSGTNSFEIYALSGDEAADFGNVLIRLKVGDGTARTKISPDEDATAPVYVWDSSRAHTSGNLEEVANNGTNQFTVSFDGALTSGTPSGGTAAPWKLGSYVTNSVTVSTTNYVEVEINGVLRKLVVAQ